MVITETSTDERVSVSDQLRRLIVKTKQHRSLKRKKFHKTYVHVSILLKYMVFRNNENCRVMHQKPD